jgi:hypothetical protein
MVPQEKVPVVITLWLRLQTPEFLIAILFFSKILAFQKISPSHHAMFMAHGHMGQTCMVSLAF